VGTLVALESTDSVDPSVALPGEERQDWSTRSRLLIALCFVLNMIDGMDILVLSYISPTLQRQWHLTTAELSAVFSAGIAGMAIGGLVVAPFADRFGRRALILIALGLMTAAMIASSTVTQVAQLIALRVVIGMGIGTVLASIAALAAAHAPPHRRDFAVGILQAGYPMGATLTGFATAAYLPVWGWRAVLLASGVASAIVFAFAFMFLPRSSREARNAREGARLAVRAVLVADRLQSTLLLWAATIGGFMALYFIASWITRLAIDAGLPETQAIVASAIYNIGSVLGVLGMSAATLRYDVRHLACLFLAMAAVVFVWFGGVRMSVGPVLLTAGVLGVALQGGLNALYPIAARIYPDAVRATGIGWAMGIGRIGAFSGPLLGGWALGHHWPLSGVFGIFCVPLLIAALCARLVHFTAEPQGSG
jgi:MFS family permease